MRIALKILVCGVSFLFTFVAVAMLFSLLLVPFAEVIDLAGHKYTGLFISDVVPFVIATAAGYQGARKALEMETARQSKVKA